MKIITELSSALRLRRFDLIRLYINKVEMILQKSKIVFFEKTKQNKPH